VRAIDSVRSGDEIELSQRNFYLNSIGPRPRRNPLRDRGHDRAAPDGGAAQVARRGGNRAARECAAHPLNGLDRTHGIVM
ncbi:hypothetical protein, partial [Burkholderia ubonensis]|uniref:hypothetical protein n=1 Tax=Burkholderia ubonensis TaxID=101571 RepID=UPI001E5A0A07